MPHQEPIQAASSARGLAYAPTDQRENLPLFKTHPQLAARLPYISLGRFPTPVEKLARVGDAIGLDSLYIKRDDLSGVVYGGNKVRKLEFLLGDALRARAREVVTLGFAGSNHALATALYANQLGLRATSLLMPQVNARYVRRNLLAGCGHKAELQPVANLPVLALGLLRKLIQGRMRFGVFPRIVPAGGSCPLGVVGYVNAAFELSEQIRAGELPAPDLIYVPLGSMGTAVGLTLGLQAVGLPTRVIAVRVIEQRFANRKKLVRLFRGTASLLRGMDPTFPRVRIDLEEPSIRDDCLGDGYARFTEKAVRAADMMREQAGIILNGSYSAKAFSAILDDASRGVLKGKRILFWNTYNSRDFSATISGVDYHQLPQAFHRYFEEPVQPLDEARLDG
jgi:1-aminocyclopropane-1-carboxylate deaminase/D-cysteine desulfhydrase-like pyridoxal-dependent ACC family enzyme